MSRMLKECRAYPGRIAVVILLGIVISSIQPVTVRLSQHIIDELQKGRDISGWVSWALIAIFAVSGLAKYFHKTGRRHVTERILMRFREGLFEKYLRLPLAELEKRRGGELLSVLQNDLAQISSGLDTLCDILREPFTFLGLIGVAFYSDWQLTLLTLVVAPLVAYLFSRSGSAVKRYSYRNLEQFSNLIALSEESIVGARVVKAFRLESDLVAKFRHVHEAYFRTIWKSIKVQELATPVVEFIGALLMAAVLAYGSYRIAQGHLTTGELVAFIIAIGLAQMPIKQLNNAFLKIKQAEAAAERVYGILDLPEPSRVVAGGKRVHAFGERIRYEDVWLSYGDKAALSGITFDVGVGECVALVGASGGGKSTIVNCLARLYEITAGRITLDGQDIRDIYLPDLRALISFVTQEVFLFNDTIYENIRYGLPGAGRKEIERAAELAHCSDFISRLPRGFNENVGDRGSRLSGGERQRVAIARAFLSGAPLLVLDEATSNLDTHSEGKVQQALDELMSGRTTLLVAHRLSTVRRASRIFVVESGRISEAGTHSELLARRGLYSSFVNGQAILTP